MHYYVFLTITEISKETHPSRVVKIRSLSSDVFERRTSTGSEPFALLISLDATIFVLLSVLTLIETICPKIWFKLRLKSAKSPLPVDVRRSKTSLLKLPNSKSRITLLCPRPRITLKIWVPSYVVTENPFATVIKRPRPHTRQIS